MSRLVDGYGGCAGRSGGGFLRSPRFRTTAGFAAARAADASCRREARALSLDLNRGSRDGALHARLALRQSAVRPDREDGRRAAGRDRNCLPHRRVSEPVALADRDLSAVRAGGVEDRLGAVFRRMPVIIVRRSLHKPPARAVGRMGVVEAHIGFTPRWPEYQRIAHTVRSAPDGDERWVRRGVRRPDGRPG